MNFEVVENYQSVDKTRHRDCIAEHAKRVRGNIYYTESPDLSCTIYWVKHHMISPCRLFPINNIVESYQHMKNTIEADETLTGVVVQCYDIKNYCIKADVSVVWFDMLCNRNSIDDELLKTAKTSLVYGGMLAVTYSIRGADGDALEQAEQVAEKLRSLKLNVKNEKEHGRYKGVGGWMNMIFHCATKDDAKQTSVIEQKRKSRIAWPEREDRIVRRRILLDERAADAMTDEISTDDTTSTTAPNDDVTIPDTQVISGSSCINLLTAAWLDDFQLKPRDFDVARHILSLDPGELVEMLGKLKRLYPEGVDPHRGNNPSLTIKNPLLAHNIRCGLSLVDYEEWFASNHVKMTNDVIAHPENYLMHTYDSREYGTQTEVVFVLVRMERKTRFAFVPVLRDGTLPTTSSGAVRVEKSLTVTRAFLHQVSFHSHKLYYAFANEASVEEPLVEEPHVEETVEEALVEETLVEETVEEAPVEEALVEETTVEEPPVETPVEEPLVEEALVEETTAEEPPVEETPVEEAPVEPPQDVSGLRLSDHAHFVHGQPFIVWYKKTTKLTVYRDMVVWKHNRPAYKATSKDAVFWVTATCNENELIKHTRKSYLNLTRDHTSHPGEKVKFNTHYDESPVILATRR